MSEATAPLPALALSGDALRRALIAEIREGRDLTRQAIAGNGALVELIMHDRRLAELEDALRLASLADAIGAAREAVPEPAPAVRHRHRRPARPRDSAPALRSVKGLVPAGGIWAALRHIGTAHPAVAAAAAGVSAVTLAATVTAVPSHPARAVTRSPAVAAAPATGIDESAVPVPSASQPSSSAPRPDTRSARKAPVVVRVPLAPPPAPSPSPPAPAPSLAPVPSPSPSPSGDPPAAVLSAAPLELDLGTAGTGQMTLSAAGGPVDWHAVCADPGVTLAGPDGAAEGTVTPGQDAALTATVSPDAQAAAGTAACSVWPGDLSVTITWDAAPVPQTAASPAPSPS